MPLGTLARDLALRFKERLLRDLPERLVEVRVFGSMARGEATEESDLDVFVLVDHFDVRVKRAIYDAAIDVGEEVGAETLISPLVMDVTHFQDLQRREILLASELLAEGIPV